MENYQSNDFKVPIINWSHGTLQTEEATKVHCEILSAVQNPRSIIAVLASNQNGSAYLSKRDETDFCNNFIILRNKNTGKIRFYESGNFLMLPYRSTAKLKTNSQIKKEEKDATQNASLSLNKAMGSKRNKRRITEIEKGNVQVDDVEKKLRKAIEENELIIKEETKTISTTNETCIPPCNRTAASVENVYNVCDLLSTEVLDSLDKVVLELQQLSVDDMQKKKRMSDFFVKLFVRTSQINPLKMKLLLFVDVLMRFLQAPIAALRKKNPIFCEFSSALNEKILNEFCMTTLDGKYSRPPSMRDKAFCYLLVCLLLINDFTIDISMLSGQISASEYAKLPLLLKAVGARVEKNSSVSYCLKLPLAELTISTRRSGSFRPKKK